MMCRENKICLVMLLLALLLLSAWGALHGQEQWYLIAETELRSIERYRRSSAAEKQAWLSQASELKALADKLLSESEALNRQLRDQREASRKLKQSFNEYEAAQSLIASQRNTRIIQLETENKEKGAVIFRLVIALAAAGLAVIIAVAAGVAGRRRG